MILTVIVIVGALVITITILLVIGVVHAIMKIQVFVLGIIVVT